MRPINDGVILDYPCNRSEKLFPVLVNASSTSLNGDRFVPGFMYFYTIYDESLLVLEREFSREAWRLKYKLSYHKKHSDTLNE